MNAFKLRYGALLLAALLTTGIAIAPAWSAPRAPAPSASSAPAAPAAPTAPAAAASGAKPTSTPNDATTTAASAAPASVASADADASAPPEPRKHRHGNGNDFVSIGRDSNLPAGETADSVVAVLGSASSAGQAGDVVSVFGDTRVTGPVSDSAVAVLGDTYVDSTVNGDAVAVLGNMELGPHAEVRGDVIDVGGHLVRDPAAVVGGSVHNVEGVFSGLHGLRAWIKDCLLYGRPLAFESAVGWAWGVALGFLALYACLALLFRGGITRCVHTFEMQPGMTALASLISVLFTPILLVLLCITVIGIPAVPFVMFGLFCAGLFGKAVMLAWLGQRCAGGRTTGPLGEPAVWVLIGGAIVLVLYVIPVVGMLVYQILSMLGLGVVVFTLIQGTGARRPSPAAGTATGAPPVAPAGAPAAAPEVAATAATPGIEGGAAEGIGGGTSAGTGAGFAGAAAGAGASAAAFSAVPPNASAAPQGAQRASAGVAASVAATLPRAGFWIRMVALLLDAVLVGILVHLLSHVSHLHLLVLAAYGAVMWKMRGSTIGGILFDLQVVRVDGLEMDWATAVVRALSCFLSAVVAGLGFLWIAFDSDKQGWHDKIAGTVVVRVPKGRSLV